MTDDKLRYDKMVERALRGVMREALADVAKAKALPGDHHFYITFDTRHPDVDIAPLLRSQYPEEMTIVLQFQFYALEVDEHGMRVSLSFSGKQERLSIPFAAIKTFADPSVNFALRFQPAVDPARAPTALAPRPAAGTDMTLAEDDAESAASGKPAAEGGNVVTLETFRKK